MSVPNTITQRNIGIADEDFGLLPSTRANARVALLPALDDNYALSTTIGEDDTDEELAEKLWTLFGIFITVVLGLGMFVLAKMIV